MISAGATILAACISAYAAVKAAKAEKNSRPVSNGFANHVITDLREIRAMLFQHVQEHDK